jgi:hypothetical protein
MPLLISLGFNYKDNYFNVIISVKTVNENVQYQLTILDVEVEKLMAGYNIIPEIDEKLLLEDTRDKEKTAIKEEIVKALAEYLEKEIVYMFLHKN